MRKQTHFKKVVSLAVAAAMAVSVCTAALADDATNEANGQPPVSEQQVKEKTSENDVDAQGEADGVILPTNPNEQPTSVAMADDVSGAMQSYGSLYGAIQAAETKVVLTANVAEDDISTWKTVEIDLNGFTISNKTKGHTINNTGNLTITDSKGGGKVDSIIHGKAAVYNAVGGNVTLKGGTYDRSYETNGTTRNSWYTIKNYGTMIIEDGVTVQQDGTANGGDTGKFSSLIDNGWFDIANWQSADSNQQFTGTPAKLIINGGTFNGGFNTIKNDDEGVMEIHGGTFTNYVNAAFQNHNIATVTAGSFSADSTYAIDDCGCDATHDVGKLTISGGSFTGTILVRSPYSDVNISGGTFTGAIKKNDGKIILSGGTFSVNPDASYLAEDYTVEEKDGKFNVVEKVVATPTPAPTATPEPTATPAPTAAPTATPAPTAAPTATPAPTAAPVEVKPAAPVVNDTALKDVTTEEKEKLVEAAESATISESKELANNETVQNVAKSADEYIAADGTVKDTLNEDIQKAADASPELKAAAANDISDITLVSAPYLAVTPQKSDDGTLVFDIKLYCALKATTDPNNMTAANTCTLKTEKIEDAPVMKITLDVGKAYSGNGLYTLYVRHVTESGAVYYYKAYSKGNGIIEFTNPHGFSTFTVLSDTRVATIKIAGKEYTYDIAAIGTELPHPDMPGYAYKGYQFDGISGSYTTLTEELFNKLAAAGKTVSATATFSAIATPAPAATAAAPEATAAPTATPAPTPDDSQYYTCKDCGHHNWTATADGYKCDTCGRVETKQLSGYKNVKGTYTPTASAAAAKTTSAIPQTSDTMPIVPIAIVMIAALLGLGVTLYMKKKHN